MTPLEVVTFKWSTPGYRSTFGATQVNTLKRMVGRWYRRPHRFSCITDDATGLDEDIRAIPLWPDLADLPSPHGGKNPSCYRRLKLFSRDAAAFIGPRFVSLDLDIVITGDLAPLWDRPEDFVIYGDTNPRTHYNGSMILMTAGARAHVWETFDPETSPAQAKAAGQFGSDQGWISHCLGPKEAKWTKADGVYSYRNDIAPKGSSLPAGARVVVFHGNVDPWGPTGRQLLFVQESYQ